MQTTKSKIMKVQQKVKKQTRFECCLRTDFYMLICETQAFIPPRPTKIKRWCLWSIEWCHFQSV